MALFCPARPTITNQIVHLSVVWSHQYRSIIPDRECTPVCLHNLRASQSNRAPTICNSGHIVLLAANSGRSRNVLLLHIPIKTDNSQLLAVAFRWTCSSTPLYV